ncbi:MAG: hypothetical protein JSV53_01360 [candidate division WOR-3 bacterium]|nr:MAG: hypothetical protein JSV53_01360 [candidate division WOR-3 bacterium]
MLTIKCSRCKGKIFRYLKVGKGQVLRCYKTRISRDNSIREGAKVLCRCGNLIGIEERNWIKMRKTAFFHTGTKINRL